VASADKTSTYGLETPTREHQTLLSVLRRRALIVIAVTVLAGAAAAAFAYATRDTFESTSKLVFSQTVGPQDQALGLIPGTPDADNLAANNVQFVASRAVAAETAKTLRQQGIDMSVDDVQSDVSVTGTRDTDLATIKATAKTAAKAATLATVYAETAQRMFDDQTKADAQRTLQNVEQQIAAQGANPDRDLIRDKQRLQTLAEVGMGSPKIIQRGFVPSAEAGNPVQIIVLGTLFGLLLGIGLALVREQSDRKLRRNEQVTAAFDAPVLTTVPRSRALKRHKPFADLPPQVAEAFRMLQMNLRFASEHPVRSVLVTSARTGEGKTTVSWNLAAAAASGGLSVALVEADLRRPSLAKRYDLDDAPGLTEALQGDVSIEEATQMMLPIAGGASPVGHPRALNVIVAGNPSPNPWALMQSSVMSRILDVLTKDHDLVVVDTPPIPHVADAISLLRHVDGVLVTASVNSTRGPDASRLRDMLQGLDAHVIGVVANGGNAVAGYAAYARATAAMSSTDTTNGDGQLVTPLVVRDRGNGEPPAGS
jgi:capsular exopolysaccharide synthesis family protein